MPSRSARLALGEGGLGAQPDSPKPPTTPGAFPPTAATPAPVNKRPGMPTWRGEGNALLVDDEPPLRVAISASLRWLGFQVTQATDGVEALKILEDQPENFRVVLLDLTMPRLDGHATLEKIRAGHGNLPVLLMSGFSEKQPDGLGEPGNAISFIKKPFTLIQLAEVLERLLSSPA